MLYGAPISDGMPVAIYGNTRNAQRSHKENTVTFPIRRLIMQLVLIGFAFTFIGCSSLATDLRKEGFRKAQQGMDAIPETPELHEVVRLRNVKIHVVGHRKHFKYGKAAAYGSPIAGYAQRNNEIWLLGKVVEGQIVLNQAILGHEFKHLLHFKNDKVADPDALHEIGM